MDLCTTEPALVPSRAPSVLVELDLVSYPDAMHLDDAEGRGTVALDLVAYPDYLRLHEAEGCDGRAPVAFLG